jgi:choline dehydrogenase-like flavoprotein
MNDENLSKALEALKEHGVTVRAHSLAPGSVVLLLGETPDRAEPTVIDSVIRASGTLADLLAEADVRSVVAWFPEAANVRLVEPTGTVARAVDEERARCAKVAREWVAMSRHAAEEAGEEIAEMILAPVQP